MIATVLENTPFLVAGVSKCTRSCVFQSYHSASLDSQLNLRFCWSSIYLPSDLLSQIPCPETQFNSTVSKAQKILPQLYMLNSTEWYEESENEKVLLPSWNWKSFDGQTNSCRLHGLYQLWHTWWLTSAFSNPLQVCEIMQDRQVLLLTDSGYIEMGEERPLSILDIDLFTFFIHSCMYT